MDWIPVHFWGEAIRKHTDKCIDAIDDLVLEIKITENTERGVDVFY